jgi:hypothetical protein
MSRSFALRTALLAAVMIAAPASAANLLVNGGFENTGFGSTTEYYNIGDTGADHAIPGDFGWTIPINNIDIIANGKYTPFLPGGGAYNIDLVGYGGTGAISQNVFTQAGQRYKITLLYTQNGGGKTADVIVNGSTLDTLVGSDQWQTYTKTFIATGEGTNFTISEGFGGSNGGIVLDNVSLTAAVPEPATWALMLTGFGMMGFAMRKRQKTVAA